MPRLWFGFDDCVGVFNCFDKNDVDCCAVDDVIEVDPLVLLLLFDVVFLCAVLCDPFCFAGSNGFDDTGFCEDCF